MKPTKTYCAGIAGTDARGLAHSPPRVWKRRLNSIAAGLAGLLAVTSLVSADTVEWRIGSFDNSGAEFTGTSLPTNYTIPSDWDTRSTWPNWQNGPDEEKWNTTISYDLSSVPAGGAEFALKTTEAGGMVPEVAVFSNDVLVGILQIVGAQIPNQGNSRRFGNTYKVYVPPQFLESGTNTLRVEMLAPTYNRNTNKRIYLEVFLDYMEFTSLSAIPEEPIHSRLIHLGQVYASNGFKVDQTRVDTEWKLWEWMGMAYSGNPIRAQYWSNIPGSNQPKRDEYLELTKDYNMTVILDRLTDKDSATNESDFIDANGDLKSAKSSILDSAFNNWGDFVQYYEISNEPTMTITDASFDVDVAIAKYVTANAPSHWITTAPGYAFTGPVGKPAEWADDDSKRIQLEQHTEATGAHSYGRSYWKDDGSLNQTIDTYGTGSPKVIENGFPVEVIMTETGSHHTSHDDFTNIGLGDRSNGKLRASMYDKNMRAHIAYADKILNFGIWDRDAPFRMMDGSRGNSSTWNEHDFPTNSNFPNPEVQNKLQVFRRLVAAYSTHGRPLAYSYDNQTNVENKLLYFRAVDTSQLAPLAGSNATANKVLLSFVNFQGGNHDMDVTVTMPGSGTYSGVRFGADPTYDGARSEVSFNASPDISISETLGPWETVTYILEIPEGGDVTLPAAADTYIQRNSNQPAGGEQNILVKAEELANNYERLGFVRFDTSGLTLPVQSAALDLTFNNVGGDYSFRILGIDESSPDEGFDESALYWDNSDIADNSNDGYDNSKVTNLGDFSLLSTDSSVSLSAQAITDFVNADTDGKVAFLIRRLDEDSPVSSIASKENTSLVGPELTIATSPDATTLLEDNFGDGNLNGWTQVDTDTNDPGNWFVSSGEVRQNNNGPESFLYWNDAAALNWSNYTVSAKLESGDNDNIGLMVGYQDASNYYNVRINDESNITVIEKVVAGTRTTLVSNGGNYSQGTPFTLEVEFGGGTITAFQDGNQIATASDSTFASGSVGLNSIWNDDSRFDDVVVTSTGPVVVLPTDDSFVRGGNNSSDNYGSDVSVMVKGGSNDNYRRQAYYRFDVSSYANAEEVLLVLPVTNVGDPNDNSLHLVSNDGWDENTITWDNRPGAGSALTDWTINASGVDIVIDVTGEANTEASGDGILSFRLEGDSVGSGNWTRYGTKENTDPAVKTRLEVTP